MKDLEEIWESEILTKVPLFFYKAEWKTNVIKPSRKVYRRFIVVDAFQTDKFESRGYHKPISKIV